MVAHQLLSKICDEFLAKYPRTAITSAGKNSLQFPELTTYITKYQDPQQADSVMKIQKELDETKIVLHKTIESVLERGEKIDNLVAKSDGLSAQSKMFYTQVRMFCLVLCHRHQLTRCIGKEAKLLLHPNVITHWPLHASFRMVLILAPDIFIQYPLSELLTAFKYGAMYYAHLSYNLTAETFDKLISRTQYLIHPSLS